MNCKKYVNIGTAFALLVALLLPVVLQYVLGYFEKVYNIIHISVYGLYLCMYLVLQIGFSVANNVLISRKVTKIKLDLGQPCSKADILVVGYKEDEDYFKMCLNSVKECYTKSVQVNKVIVVIDGNHETDNYMVDVFETTFDSGNSCVIRLTDYKDILNYRELVKNKHFVCITQPHCSKRRAMYTGFKLSLFDKNTQNVLCTDSDTVLDDQVVENMTPLFSDHKLGAVAGNLGIYTKYDSIMSFLSSLRYWYAFNMERAYQSFNKYVLCVSGPIGMYRLDILKTIIDDWMNQTFLGQQCTYGDDRHLTNLILSKGYNVVYVPNAKAETETPSNISRFYRQQTRWSKSAYREFLWSITQVLKQNVFMTFDLIYLLFFPYVVMGYLMYILYFGSLWQFQMYTIIIGVTGAIKTLFGTIAGQKLENVFYLLYIIPYVCIVFPAKIWALLNIKDISWGTQSRRQISSSKWFSMDIVFLSLWNVLLLVSYAYHLYRHFYELQVRDFIWLFCFTGLSIVVTLYVKYMKKT